MTRVFFALSVEEELAGRLTKRVAEALEGAAHAKRYLPGDLHVTLAFLGEIPADRMESLRRCATEEFRGLVAPELRLGGSTYAFPSVEEPRALLASVEESHGAGGRLDVLRNRAQQVGLSHGWRPSRADRERPYRPHVTVARNEVGESVPEDFWSLSLDRAWLPVDIVLCESLERRGEDGGPRYRPIAAWPLVVQPG